MSGFAALTEELDAWGEAGRTATFWWRDDDASAPEPALTRLLALRKAHDVPLCLAVIPEAKPFPDPGLAALAAAIGAERDIRIAQHGFAHRNHAAAGLKKSEYPSGRDLGEAVGEIRTGRERLQNLFGVRLLPILVPPWNRMAPEFLAHLPPLGFTALSAYGPSTPSVPGLKILNTHLDPLAWRLGGGFLGEAEALAPLLAHLKARREGTSPVTQPSGLLTHHLVMDAAALDFTARFLERTRAHAAARWIDLPQALAP